MTAPQLVTGELALSPGYVPAIDADALAAHEIARERFASARFSPAKAAS
jgi:hypothetical protein